MADTADRASPPPDDAAGLRYLERFLAGDEGAGFDLRPLEARGLAAFAYGRAQAASGDGAPVGATEARLRMAYVMARARHAIVRKATRDLLAAWHDAGIETLLTKGFALAEYVYPDPAWRFYSDVDVAIAPVHLERAAQLAPEHGWNVMWRAGAEVGVNSRRGGAYQGHELLTLYHPATDVNMDVHRRLVHNNDNRLARWAKQEAITRAAWRASRPDQLDGVPVRLLDPRDAALVGLVLNRSWSSDAFALRAHDYLDLRFLAEHGGVTRAALEERAHELGCERTLALFLERCDPYRRHLDLTPPSRNQRLRWDAVLASERGHRGAERLVLDATRAPTQALEVLRELPYVAGRVWRWREGAPNAADRPLQTGASATESATTVPSAAESAAAESSAAESATTERSPAEPPALDRETWRRVQRGVRRALRICGVSPRARPDLALACARDALRRRGLPAAVEQRPEGAVLVVAGAVLDVSGLGLGPEPEPS